MLSVEAEADKTLRDLHNSSYDTRAELVLTLETSEMSAIFVSTINQNNSTSSLGLLG